MPVWVSLVERFGDAISFIGYDYYAGKLDKLVDIEKFKSYSFGPRKIVIFIVYLFSIYYYPYYRKYFINGKFDLYFKLFFIGVCAYYLFDNTIVIFRRPVRYFDIFALPIVGYTLSYLKYSKRSLYRIMFASSISFLYLQCVADISVQESLRKSSLFQFYFFNE